MTDPAKIAKGLTKAQREKIIRAELVSGLWEIPSKPEDDLSDLECLGITGQGGWLDALTPLGLAVRAILENDHGRS